MIVGVGLDLCDVNRLRRAMQRRGFRERVFDADEVRDCEARARRHVHYSARFAAKEAFFKAIGTGWGRGVAWKDVVVVSGEAGAPILRVRGAAARHADALGMRRAHVSLTHAGDYAAAVVVIEADDGPPRGGASGRSR